MTNFLAGLALALMMQGPTIPMGSISTGTAPTSFTLVETVTNLSNTTCGTGVTATLGTNTTSGEMISVVYFGSSGGGAMTITDSGSESYTKAWERTGLSVHYTSGLAYFIGAAGVGTASGISSVTVSGGSNVSCGLIVQHWKRSTGTWAVDQVGGASATGQSSPWASPAVTTTATHELMFGGAFAQRSSGANCTMAASGAWSGHSSSNDADGNDAILLNQTVSSIQTNIQATGTTTCTAVGTWPGIATFQ